MAALLVTYDLKKPSQDYKELIDAIKKYAWARLSESSYAIDASDETPKQVYTKLSQYIDKDDQLFVVSLKTGWHGRGSEKIYEWLNNHL